MKLSILIILTLAILLPASARHPEKNGYGEKQLDIKKLERTFEVKFSIPFPERRFDIDYWSKGDLAALSLGKIKVLLTCPYLQGGDIKFAMGSGTNASNFRMTADLSVGINQAGEPNSVLIMRYGKKIWPKSMEMPRRKSNESVTSFLTRAEKFWTAAAAKAGTGRTGKVQITTAFKLIRVALQQKEVLTRKAKR